MAYDNQFEDEIAIDTFDEIPVSEEKIQFDGLEQAAAKAERRRKRRRLRNERTGKIAACVILICIIVAIVLSVTFVKETEHILYQDSYLSESESPTMLPTVAKPTIRTTSSPTTAPKPTFSVLTPSPTGPITSPPIATPTDSPTVAPTSVMVDTYTFEPVADTYLHLNGPHKSKIYGREETLSVQRGNIESTKPGEEVTLPTIVSVIEFDTTKKSGAPEALPKRSRWPEAEGRVKVMLRIHHVPKDSPMDPDDELSIEDILPVNVEVYRLRNNHDMIIESLAGEDFHNAPKSVTEGILIAQELVEAADTVVEIDVTSALFLPEDATGYGDDQVLLLLKVYWEETPTARDMFSSRESDGLSPQLIFSNMVSEEL